MTALEPESEGEVVTRLFRPAVCASCGVRDWSVTFDSFHDADLCKGCFDDLVTLAVIAIATLDAEGAP